MKRSWANRVARVFLLWVAFPLWGGEPENQLRSRLIWQGDAVNLWGSPSPDGKWLSFVDGSTGALALRNVQDGSTRPIPGASGGGTGEFAYFSTFDRTGGRIAFAWFNSNGHYELRVAAVDSADSRPGSTEVLFSNPEVRFVQPCAWSHDGERVLTLFFRQDNTSQIALVDVVDRSVHVLRSLPWIYPKRMDLSPDGRYLVYDNLAEPDGSERDLYVMRTDGTQEWRLLDGPADDQSPVWAHNGDSIWFVSDRGGSQSIWRVGVHRGKAADAPQRLRGPLPRVLLIGATRSGDVFFGLRKGAAQLYSQDWGPSSGSVSSAAVPMYEEVLAGDRLLPVFAPDGEGIAFLAQVGTENQGRGHQAVVLQSIESGQSEPLSTRLAFVQAMRFAPDGASLLLSGSDRRGRSGLFLHDRQTGRTRPLELVDTHSVEGIPGSFSSSGKSVFLAVSGPLSGRLDLVERSLEGDGGQRLIGSLPRGKRVIDITASPNSRQIALAWASRGASGGATLAMVDARGGPLEPILTLPQGELTDVAWDPGGAQLLVGTRGHAGARLWLVSATGDSMTEVPSPKDRRPGLSFSPDGKRLAYAAGRTQQEVWVLQHVALER